jgi:hypothetical protein
VLSGGEFFILVGSIGSLMIAEWVVVGGHHSTPKNAIWIDVGRIELISPTESECHAILRGDLASCKWIESGQVSACYC